MAGSVSGLENLAPPIHVKTYPFRQNLHTEALTEISCMQWGLFVYELGQLFAALLALFLLCDKFLASSSSFIRGWRSVIYT